MIGGNVKGKGETARAGGGGGTHKQLTRSGKGGVYPVYIVPYRRSLSNSQKRGVARDTSVDTVIHSGVKGKGVGDLSEKKKPTKLLTEKT